MFRYLSRSVAKRRYDANIRSRLSCPTESDHWRGEIAPIWQTSRYLWVVRIIRPSGERSPLIGCRSWITER